MDYLDFCQNPSFNEEHTIGAHQHNDVDLEAILRWHALSYLCIILGCYGDVYQITNMGNEDSHNANMQLQGDGAFDIHEDAPTIAHLQVGKILIGLTPN